MTLIPSQSSAWRWKYLHFRSTFGRCRFFQRYGTEDFGGTYSWPKWLCRLLAVEFFSSSLVVRIQRGHGWDRGENPSYRVQSNFQSLTGRTCRLSSDVLFKALEPCDEKILVRPGLGIVDIFESQLCDWFPYKRARPAWFSNDHERHLLCPSGVSSSKKCYAHLDLLVSRRCTPFLRRGPSKGLANEETKLVWIPNVIEMKWLNLCEYYRKRFKDGRVIRTHGFIMNVFELQPIPSLEVWHPPAWDVQCQLLIRFWVFLRFRPQLTGVVHSPRSVNLVTGVRVVWYPFKQCLLEIGCRSGAPFFDRNPLTCREIGEGFSVFENTGDFSLIWVGFELEFVFFPLRWGPLRYILACLEPPLVLREDPLLLLYSACLSSPCHVQTVAVLWVW